MQKFTETVIKDGKPIQGLTVNVTNYPAGTPATIYSSTGAAVDSVLTDANGRLEFYAPNGRYSVTVSGAGINSYTLPDIVLFDPADAGAQAVKTSGGVTVEAALGSKADASVLAAKAPLDSPAFTGKVGIGTTSPAERLDVRNDTSGSAIRVSTTDNANILNMGWKTGVSYIAAAGYNGPSLSFETGGSERARIDASGNLLVGVTSASYHRIFKAAPADAGNPIIEFQPSASMAGLAIFATSGSFGSTSGATAWVGKHSSNGRSVNAGGTINASGADYAEYMTKADGCGDIAKGAIVGVDADGKLTDKWAAAVSFVVKSTDPSYVGGDTWGNEAALGVKRPVEPAFVPPEYAGAPHPGEAPAEDASDEVRAAYGAALAARQADQQAHAEAIATARAEFDTVTMPAYHQALAEFNAVLEAARQRVDRIAYCGQVPVNVLGAKPGEFILPDNGGTPWDLMADPEVPAWFKKFVRSVGVVQNILPDGRANVRVKVV